MYADGKKRTEYMKIVTSADPNRIVEQAADAVEALVLRNPRAVLGIATGSTPEALYAELAKRSERGLNLSELRVTCLDEYLGLPSGHAQNYRHYIEEKIVKPWGVDFAATVLPDVDGPDPEVAAAKFEAEIAALGGVDLQILGLGTNGHIGFNEPGSPVDSRTRVVELTQSTREANARFFGSADQVPTHAITQGVGTILEARQLLLLAFGEAKTAAVEAMVSGPVASEVPASALQRHPALEVFLDTIAAGRVGQELLDAEPSNAMN